MPSKLRLYRIIFLAEALIIAGFVFAGSAMDGQQSGRLSAIIARWIAGWLPHGLISFGTLHTLVRKAAHFGEYALFGQAIMCLLTSFFPRKYPFITGGVAIGLCAAYAALDELHQKFVAGRGPALADVGIDSLGALTGILLSVLAISLVRRCRRSRKATIPNAEV